MRRSWIIIGAVLLLLVCGLWLVGTVRNAGEMATKTAATPAATSVVEGE